MGRAIEGLQEGTNCVAIMWKTEGYLSIGGLALGLALRVSATYAVLMVFGSEELWVALLVVGGRETRNSGYCTYWLKNRSIFRVLPS